MSLLMLITDNWYDIRDLGNVSHEILYQLDRVLPYSLVYIIAALMGFVASFLIFVLPSQLFVGVLGERKIIGRMQSRYGPNRVGKFGLLQPIADAIKLIQKEALTPKAADKAVMYIAPIVFVAPAVLLFAVVPFGGHSVFADIPVSIVYFIAISGLPVLAAFIGGWSHANKYSLFGSMRIVAMTISYEVPLVLSLLSVVLITGTMRLGGHDGIDGIVQWQRDYHIWLIFLQPLAFLIYFFCVSAELNRTPTDIAEAESEIVAGYLTEYSGMKWGLFYGMDIGYALAAAAFASTVFLGGWSMFGLDRWIPSWLIIIAKTHLFYFIFIWTRGTLPRLRIDQLMTFAWKFLLPLSLANLLVIATEKVIWNKATDGNFDNFWVYIFAAVNILLSVAAVFIWARLLGYRPEATPKRPRLVNTASGYVPIPAPSREVR